jgi:cytidine deaminase
MDDAIKSIKIPTQEELLNERKWIEDQLQEIGDDTLTKLIQQTLEAQKNTYSPYSHYAVGAALLTESGAIYQGCNAEVVNYSITVHAEGSAITNAIAHGEAKDGNRKFIRAIMFASDDNDIGPCAQCRQHIAEHCDNCLIISINRQGEIGLTSSLNILNPFPFNPSKLGIK